jgi:hypothetical protein
LGLLAYFLFVQSMPGHLPSISGSNHLRGKSSCSANYRCARAPMVHLSGVLQSTSSSAMKTFHSLSDRFWSPAGSFRGWPFGPRHRVVVVLPKLAVDSLSSHAALVLCLPGRHVGAAGTHVGAAGRHVGAAGRHVGAAGEHVREDDALAVCKGASTERAEALRKNVVIFLRLHHVLSSGRRTFTHNNSLSPKEGKK